MSQYQARWTSKGLAVEMKKSGVARQGLLLDSFKGFIMVEPAGQRLGDGPLLTPVEIEAELRPEWCQESRTRIAAARQLLGLGRVRS